MGPFEEREFAALEVAVKFLRFAAERPIERIADGNGLPGQRVLRGPRGFAEAETEHDKTAEKHGQVGSRGEVRFIDVADRAGRAFGQAARPSFDWWTGAFAR